MCARKAKLYRSKNTANNFGSSFDWDDLIEIYLESCEANGVKESTLIRRRDYFKTFTKYNADNGIKPHEYDTAVARAYVTYLRKDHVKHAGNHYVKNQYKTKGLAPATVATIVQLVRSAFAFWINEQYLDLEFNPFDRIKAKRNDLDNVTALSIEEVKKLLKAPDQRTYAGFRDYVLITLLIDTGLRISEALSLTWECVDFKSSVIEIRGKIAKNGRTRYVPFSRRTSRLLRELKAEAKTMPEYADPNVFLSVYGNKLDPHRLRQRLRKYARDAKIKSRVTPHVLRHTFAKYYLLNHGDVMTLQKILGHSSMDMVRRYVQMTDQDVKEKHAEFSPIKRL